MKKSHSDSFYVENVSFGLKGASAHGVAENPGSSYK